MNFKTLTIKVLVFILSTPFPFRMEVDTQQTVIPYKNYISLIDSKQANKRDFLHIRKNYNFRIIANF